jgi:hypothetical protein
MPNKEMHVIQIIESGKVDRALERIRKALDDRQVAREAEALKQAKEVFGDNAEIVVPKPPVLRQPNTILCGAETGGIPTCGPAADCPHGRS